MDRGCRSSDSVPVIQKLIIKMANSAEEEKKEAEEIVDILIHKIRVASYALSSQHVADIMLQKYVTDELNDSSLLSLSVCFWEKLNWHIILGTSRWTHQQTLPFSPQTKKLLNF